MGIERLHFENGRPLNIPRVSIGQEAAIIFINNEAKAQILPEGEYDITPKTRGDTQYRLKVLGNGNAIFKSNFDNGITRGETNVLMPKESQIEFISGPLEDGKTIGIYEIIVHVIDPKK